MTSVVNRPRRTVASYDDYAEAERAVDYLSDHGFPVERVAIVGHGLRYVEQVQARVTAGRAALVGAFQGAILGVIFGALASIFFVLDPSPAPALLLLYGLAVGAFLGALLGVLAHLAAGSERDFASVAGWRPIAKTSSSTRSWPTAPPSSCAASTGRPRQRSTDRLRGDPCRASRAAGSVAELVELPAGAP